MALLFEMSKVSHLDAIFIRDKLYELCNRYPDYEAEAQNRIWLEVNKYEPTKFERTN
jgi:hypothetical protein